MTSWQHHGMPSDQFADRFDREQYADDPGVGVFEISPEETDALWLPERIFARLIGVASAYHLHTLSQLGGMDPIQLNRLQCEAALDEVAFVAERLSDDPLIAELAQAVCDYLAVRIRRPGWNGYVTVDPV